MYHHLQVAQSEVGNIQRQNLAIEKALQQERKASELSNQQFIELQECHDELVKEYASCEKIQEDLKKSATDSRMFADEVAKRAESLLNNSSGRLAEGDVDGSQNGQSISGMLLESAKNALIVQAISSQRSEDEEFTKLRDVMDQNVDFQCHIMKLQEQIKTLSQQVEDGKNEVASLNKALELATEDGRRKKSRRGKTPAMKNQ
ncbi:hypothetical protein COCVIDRAFT_112784 [Bipolaris victoriae FI3]|uniref:Uncharacterized protein n=1 Tax=Bipolaris victoriae (strain FI3) TaxID=930091 RepID=W7DUW0_BIPV3|nr:hypothetical protein COCVIDRAFT_112784 [Bipolaris victoriae FI3]